MKGLRRVWTCSESEFRLCWMKLCRSDNHYTTAPQYTTVPQHCKPTFHSCTKYASNNAFHDQDEIKFLQNRTSCNYFCLMEWWEGGEGNWSFYRNKSYERNGLGFTQRWEDTPYIHYDIFIIYIFVNILLYIYFYILLLWFKMWSVCINQTLFFKTILIEHNNVPPVQKNLWKL